LEWHLNRTEYQQAQNLAATYAVNKRNAAAKQPAGLPVVTAMLGHALTLSGRDTEARAKLQELITISYARYVARSYIGIIYIALGDKDQAFDWLERTFKTGQSICFI
jgi:Flp pilus assembly protein TadD